MKVLKQKGMEYLSRNGMDAGAINLDRCCKLFLEEMRRGLEGGQSTLAMIPTYIAAEREVPRQEPVIALDAGGTNFRVATLSFNERCEPVIENFLKFSMPGIEREVGKEEFFNIIVDYLERVSMTSNRVGFCFSYPTEIKPNKDGRLITFSKEIKASAVKGELIGEGINRALQSRGLGKKNIVILNDTVATLLAGKTGFPDRSFSSYIGFILGTGTNCCYLESNRNIAKIENLEPEESQIINVETGGFGGIPQGSIDRDFDATTVNPGHYTFEKMVSGAYLGPLCLRTIHTACDDGLLSSRAVHSLRFLEQLSTEEVNEFLTHPLVAQGTLAGRILQAESEDRIILYHLLDGLVERAAKLSAVTLSSVILKSGQGEDPCSPVCIMAEGSTFYGLKSMCSRVECYLKNYLQEQKDRYYEIHSVENAALIGAAIAGLTN